LELPSELKAELASAAHHSVVSTEDGVLLSLDQGEFGAGLYWVESAHAHSGSHAVRIQPAAEPIRWIARVSFGIVGVAGLCHGDACAARSAVYRIERSGDGWRLSSLAEWTGCPASASVEPGGQALLIATCGGLKRVHEHGVESVGRWPRAWNLPVGEGSITRDADGRYFVSFGTRVVELQRGHEPVWLAPPDCVTIGTTPEGACRCSQH
jgi:hypothetical protein